jgi:hypothetical protein
MVRRSRAWTATSRRRGDRPPTLGGASRRAEELRGSVPPSTVYRGKRRGFSLAVLNAGGLWAVPENQVGGASSI